MPTWYKPKELAESLELDYVLRPRALTRWLRHCTWAAGGLALVYVAWVLWPSHHQALQAGPVSNAHALFSQDCGKCHTALFATANRLVPGNSASYSVPDQACLNCHQAPAHNSWVPADNCVRCHKEHRGHDFLVRPGDRLCTDCHTDLKSRFPSAAFENVGSFVAHPEFKLWRDKEADPGNVKFNHAKHLILKLEDLKPASLEPLIPGFSAALANLKQQRCLYCHQSDADGKYMAPIRFDQHCQTCHPLLTPGAEPDTILPESFKNIVKAFQMEPLLHPKSGETVAHVRAQVRERYLAFAQMNSSLLNLQRIPEDQWTVQPELIRPREPATKSQIDWVNQHWARSEELLFDRPHSGCAYCHTDLSKPKRRVGQDGMAVMDKPSIPSRWLNHSVFDHHAHRGLACTSCHEQALTSEDRGDVLIPRLATCQSCHQTGSARARADCLECHQFHHRAGIAPAQGKLSIQEFLGQVSK